MLFVLLTLWLVSENRIYKMKRRIINFNDMNSEQQKFEIDILKFPYIESDSPENTLIFNLYNNHGTEYLQFIQLGYNNMKEQMILRVDLIKQKVKVADQSCKNCVDIKIDFCKKQKCNVKYYTRTQLGYILKTNVYINQFKLNNQTTTLVKKQLKKQITNMVGYNPKSDLCNNVFRQNYHMQKMVAIYFGNHQYSFDSQIVIGGLNRRLIKKGHEIRYHKNHGNDQWRLNTKQIKLSSHSISSQNMYSVLDNRRFGVIFPFRLYRTIKHVLQKYYEMRNCHSYYLFKYYRKESKLGCRIYYNKNRYYKQISLVFTIENKNYKLKYDQIIYKCMMRLMYKVCLFNINYQPGLSYVKLGNTFLTNYYLILNYENNTIGLVESEKGKIVFKQTIQWRNMVIKTVTIWGCIFILFICFNHRELDHYNRLIHKLFVYLYNRLVNDKQDYLDLSDTSISYRHYDEFIEYLDKQDKQEIQSQQVNVSAFMMNNVENVESVQIQQNNNQDRSMMSDIDNTSNVNVIRYHNQIQSSNMTISRMTSDRYQPQSNLQTVRNIMRGESNNEQSDDQQINNQNQLSRLVQHESNNRRRGILLRQRRIMMTQNNNHNNHRSLNIISRVPEEQ